MKKKYPLMVIIVIMFILFFMYTYKVTSILIKDGYKTIDFSEVKMPVLSNKFNNIYYDFNDFLDEKFKIKMTDYNKEILLLKQNDNNIIKLSNIYERIDINKVIKFSNSLMTKNKNFTYIIVPEKSYFFLNQINKYNYFSYLSYNSRTKLKMNSVDYVDSYEILNQSNILPSKLFYKTDTHWTLETGLYFTKKLTEHINETYSLNIDSKKLDVKNYKQKTFKNSYRGAFSIYNNKNQKDDFIYYIPEFDTNFTVENKKGKRIGNINEVIYDINKIENKNDHNTSRYCRIPGGTSNYVKIINNNSDNNIKLLFIGNSYIKSIVPFISPLVEETVIIDIRSNVGNYNESIQGLINTYNPDLVLQLTEIDSENDYKKLMK